MTALENCIADSMEESMQPYIRSDEYQKPKAAINQKIIAFRKGLSEAQQKEFNQIIDSMDDVHAKFTSKAYVYGVVNGIALREQIL